MKTVILMGLVMTAASWSWSYDDGVREHLKAKSEHLQEVFGRQAAGKSAATKAKSNRKKTAPKACPRCEDLIPGNYARCVLVEELLDRLVRIHRIEAVTAVRVPGLLPGSDVGECRLVELKEEGYLIDGQVWSNLGNDLGSLCSEYHQSASPALLGRARDQMSQFLKALPQYRVSPGAGGVSVVSCFSKLLKKDATEQLLGLVFEILSQADRSPCRMEPRDQHR